ncbi:hypothetical protein HWV62_1769 [Athelia sp. TMB]|nr:hypothetical protein HWV62_1769 [Athelia sp. TMB]
MGRIRHQSSSGGEEPTPSTKTQDKSTRVRQKTANQQRNDIEARDKEIEKLKKQLKKQAAQKRKRATVQESDDDDDEPRLDKNGVPFESEDDDDADGGAFGSSMKKLGPALESPAKNLRREKISQRHSTISHTAAGTPSQHRSDNEALFFPPSSPEPPGPQTPHDDELYPYLNTTNNSGRARKKRLKRASSSSPPPPTRPQSEHDDGILKAEFQNGQEPAHGSRPAAKDYKRPTYNRLICAIRDFETQVYTNKPFPDPDEQVELAKKCWGRVNAALEQKMEFTDRMLVIVSCRGSRARGQLVGVTRSLVVEHYEFSRITSAKSARANREKAEALLEDGAFHYKDIEHKSGFTEHKIIVAILQQSFFKTKSSPGVKFSKAFHPVPLATLALIHSVIDFCICEWSNGSLKQQAFQEQEVKTRYEGYAKKLEQWSNTNHDTTKNIRKKMSNRARKAIGVMLEAADEPDELSEFTVARIQNELANRTGETDSEVEVEADS